MNRDLAGRVAVAGVVRLGWPLGVHCDRVVGLADEQLAVGLRVVIDFDHAASLIALPRSRPAVR